MCDNSLAGGFFILLYYIPIYFQAVRNTSATASGIRNLALILSDSKLPFVFLPISLPLSPHHPPFLPISFTHPQEHRLLILLNR